MMTQGFSENQFHSKELKYTGFVSTTRRETLKAAGGRAALNEKLKKTRGSLLKSQQMKSKSNSKGLKRAALQPLNSNTAGPNRTGGVPYIYAGGKENPYSRECVRSCNDMLMQFFFPSLCCFISLF
jgi:hypothetical protein